MRSKLDNRGIGVAYTYDALNRMLSKSYINVPGTANFQAVSDSYDNPSVSYSRGRLTASSTLMGSVSTTNYTSYDPLGRIIKSNQVTAGQTYPFSYTYNLADAVTTETYPSNRTVATCYDPANRVAQVGAAACNSNGGAYATAVVYAPQGSPAGYTMGNGDARQFGYNSRLQMTSLSDSVNGQTLFQGTLNYGGGSNNGNLQSSAFQWGGPGYTNPLLFSQSYSYDGLNRLVSGSDSGGWSRQPSDDAYGNMTPGGNPPPPPVSFNGNNQLVGVAYD